jgi:hypothetical protein
MITVYEDTVYMQTPDCSEEVMTMKTAPYQFTELKDYFAFITEEVFYGPDAEEDYCSILTIYEKSTFKKIFEHHFMETDANWILPTGLNELYIGFVNYIYKYNVEDEEVVCCARDKDTMFSSMCLSDDKLITLSRNGRICVWKDKQIERDIIISNQRMASCIYKVDERYLIWTHTTATRKQALFLLDDDFNIIQETELPMSTFTNLYKINDRTFLGVHHRSITKTEISIIRVEDTIHIHRVPFTGRIIDPAIPHDGRLLVDKQTSYGWFNIHTYEMEPCDGLTGNILFYYLINK